MEFSGCDKGNKTKSDAEDEENRADPQEHAGHTAVRSVPQLLQERCGNVVAVEVLAGSNVRDCKPEADREEKGQERGDAVGPVVQELHTEPSLIVRNHHCAKGNNERRTNGKSQGGNQRKGFANMSSRGW